MNATTRYLTTLVLLLCTLGFAAHASCQSAKDIIRKANNMLHGNSSTSTATMTVIKPDWSRQMTTKLWMLEPKYALILITAPAKDRGTVTLKRQTEMAMDSLHRADHQDSALDDVATLDGLQLHQ